jgi:hypothetical protein
MGATYRSKTVPLTIFHLSVADGEEPEHGWISVSFDIAASVWLMHAALSQDRSRSAFSGLDKTHENRHAFRAGGYRLTDVITRLPRTINVPDR